MRYWNLIKDGEKVANRISTKAAAEIIGVDFHAITPAWKKKKELNGYLVEEYQNIKIDRGVFRVDDDRYIDAISFKKRMDIVKQMINVGDRVKAYLPLAAECDSEMMNATVTYKTDYFVNLTRKNGITHSYNYPELAQWYSEGKFKWQD